jgi:predicted NBD/HSP70 family sugar kinase
VRVAQKATRTGTREQNATFVLQLVYASAPTTRAEIARETGLTAATVSDIVGGLLDDGIVQEVGFAASTGGKPPVLLDIDAASRSVVTLDLSGSQWIGTVHDLRLNILHRTLVPHDDLTGADAVAAVKKMVKALTSAAPNPILGIGVGTPGVVTGDGTVVEAANLGWRNLPLADVLSECCDWPVHIVNDARATAVAEYLLGDHGTKNMLVVKIGRGVGSGIVLDGNTYEGEGSAAGEIGHIAAIPRPTGTVTLESVASTPALATAMASIAGIDFQGRPSKFIATQLDINPQAYGSVIEQLGSDLASILAIVVGTLDLHHIILSGPIDSLREPLLDAVRSGLAERLLPALCAKIEVSFGDIDERTAVATGVCTYVIREELGVA